MSVNGMSYPQQKPMSSGSPGASALNDSNQAALKHAELIKATSGGRRTKRRSNKRRSRKHCKHGGAANTSTTNGTVVVPQMTVPYKSTGANGQDPNSIITNNAKSSTQGAENAKNDSAAFTKTGGRKSCKRHKRNKKHKKHKTYKRK
jgi:hypothetical protein